MNGFTLYTSLQGRISRQTFWLWGLPYVPAHLCAKFIDAEVFPGLTEAWSKSFGVTVQVSVSGGPITWLIHLLFLWPVLALSVKRLHDLGRSGWLVAPLAPLLVGLLLAVWLTPSSPAASWLFLALGGYLTALQLSLLFVPGAAGLNRYGPDPRPKVDHPANALNGSLASRASKPSV